MRYVGVFDTSHGFKYGHDLTLLQVNNQQSTYGKKHADCVSRDKKNNFTILYQPINYKVEDVWSFIKTLPTSKQ